MPPRPNEAVLRRLAWPRSVYLSDAPSDAPNKNPHTHTFTHTHINTRGRGWADKRTTGGQAGVRAGEARRWADKRARGACGWADKQARSPIHESFIVKVHAMSNCFTFEILNSEILISRRATFILKMVCFPSELTPLSMLRRRCSLRSPLPGVASTSSSCKLAACPGRKHCLPLNVLRQSRGLCRMPGNMEMKGG